MTGGLIPAPDASGDDAQHGLRASDQDREHVVEILRSAAGDGRLTVDELDERLEAALSARTFGDLAPLTADLPAESVPSRAADFARIDQGRGRIARTGRWSVPRRMEIRVKLGEVRLDFTEALIRHGVLDIEVDLGLGGELLLITRPGVVVEADGLERNSGQVKVAAASGPGADPVLRVRLAGRSRGGQIVARPPRRSLAERLRRHAPEADGR
ncbi:DUF1707 domain-containing protein [Streptomyces sp. RFCAC02]|uniref:DUF1707 SHOCT-like domain-containing protein n=1 Tax=Streptomyces sp. RFCAC02 TaxID=2499143 RepID=UPI001020B5A8|nr:DUF1707 domain-containing protein [Streptomyces sp. RFCAC02]